MRKLSITSRVEDLRGYVFLSNFATCRKVVETWASGAEA